MKNTYSTLLPIKPTVLRLSFGFVNPLDKEINPFEILRPSIHHFEKFAISRFFWFIVDLVNWKHVCGGGAIEEMTPLKKSEFFDDNHQKLHDITHPEDLLHVMAFSKFWVNYFLAMPRERRLYSKMTLYFRIMNPMKEYYWIMVQYSDGILDDNDKIVYGLVFATDISHLKKDGKPMMSILDTWDGNCQHFFCSEQKEIAIKKEKTQFTLREIEILNYIIKGSSSKQIAAQLNLSIKTIDNHRQNMLRKTKSKSTGELVAYSITNGYV